MSNYRKADTRAQWFQNRYPGGDMQLTAQTAVLTVHTTEGTTWPGYSGGAEAPNYTGLPPLGLRFGKWRAHFPDEKSSRALVNSYGGVETNTLNTIQVELIGTCDPAHAVRWGNLRAGKDYVYWPAATKAQLRWLARFVLDLNIRHGLQLVAPRPFKAYPSSYGTGNGVRLSGAAWQQTVGIVGHQHIPENVHGDPGNIDIGYVLDVAKAYRATYDKKHPPTKGK